MTDTAARVGLLFPGQGSQEPNMGRDLAEASRDAMDLWKKAERISNAPLREIYWEGDEQTMSRTEYLQPALTVVNVALWSEIAGRVAALPTPPCLAGHSLGEFSALAAAGVLPVDAVLEAVSLRGRLMAEADPEGRGKMAAVLKLERPVVEDLVAQTRERIGQELLVANYNSPAQFVVSGVAAAVDALDQPVRQAKGRLVPLPVSGAFHSPLMRDAARELESCLKRLDWRKPKYPLYCNVTAEPVVDADAIAAVMMRQMTSSVRWIEVVANMWKAGVRRWFEIGPKSVLTKLLKANLATVSEPWEGEAVGTLASARALLPRDA